MRQYLQKRDWKGEGRGQCIALPANCDQHETPWINHCFNLPPLDVPFKTYLKGTRGIREPEKENVEAKHASKSLCELR